MCAKRVGEWWLKTSPFDILIFIDSKNGNMATWTELENFFVKRRGKIHISTQTLSNYLKTLLIEGFISKTICESTLQPVYVIKNPIKIPIIEAVRRAEKKLAKAIEQQEVNWEKLSSDLLLEFEIGHLMTKAYHALYTQHGKPSQEAKDLVDLIESKVEKLCDNEAKVEVIKKIRKLRADLEWKSTRL